MTTQAATSNVIKLTLPRIKEAQYERRVWVAMPPHNTPFEKLLDPNYWAHIATKLKQWDRIEVQPDGFTFFAELLVVDSDRTWAKVRVLRYVDLSAKGQADLFSAQPAAVIEAAAKETEVKSEADEDTTPASIEDSPFLVEFKGSKKWCVIRKEDGEILKEGYVEKSGANKYARNLIRRLKD